MFFDILLCHHSWCPLPTREMLLGPVHVEYPVERGYPWDINKVYSNNGTIDHSRPRALRRMHEATRPGRLLAIVHCPLIPHTSPLSSLAQFTNKSFVTFCKQHLYGSHAFAGRKVAYYSRYSLGTRCSSDVNRRKTSTTHKGRRV